MCCNLHLFDLFNIVTFFQAYFCNWENWLQCLIIIDVLLISFHVNPIPSLTSQIRLIEPWQHHAAAIGVFLVCLLFLFTLF